MTKPRLILVCNALDDETRLERGITTDSPAASRKVFSLCAALRTAGVNAVVLSLGRGRADGRLRWHAAEPKRVHGVPVLYAPFTRLRLLSEFVSLIAPIRLLLRLARKKGSRDVVLFYNRLGAYVPTLLMARALKMPTHFDLEDGEVGRNEYLSWLLRRLYDRTCSTGALLACSALAEMTAVRPNLCYYGVSTTKPIGDRWRSDYVTVMLGGTLSNDTGVPLLLSALKILKAQPERPGASHLRFEITGQGPALQALRELAATAGGSPDIVVHGRTTDSAYDAILARCEVGLALKPSGGPLAQTTFPSKVVEMASAGLLVLTTDISDVRLVLGDGALYLETEDGETLANLLCNVAMHRHRAQMTALSGQQAAAQQCEPRNAGLQVAQFIFDKVPC